ncbi:MAG: hypothetical protein ACRC4G_03055 [Alphaproteobacteria bacterium]
MCAKKKEEIFLTPGSRLRAIRAFCASSRQLFCQETGISESTLKAWENDVSPLTGKGANLLAKIFHQRGIGCTQAWLLRGEEPSPIRKITLLPSSKLGEEDYLAQEIALLQACYQRPRSRFIAFAITAHEMEPFFQKGDWIAGVEVSAGKLKTFLQMPLIVQDSNNTFSVRQFIGIHAANTLMVRTLHNNSAETPTDVLKVKSVYQIVWHRRCLKS